MKKQSTSRIICLLHTVLGTWYIYLKSNRWYVMWINKQSSPVVSVDLSANHINDEWMSLWNGMK